MLIVLCSLKPAEPAWHRPVLKQTLMRTTVSFHPSVLLSLRSPLSGMPTLTPVCESGCHLVVRTKIARLILTLESVNERRLCGS